MARGDVFTAPDREGPDAQPDRHLERARQWARWSPDGKRDRLHLRPQRRGRRSGSSTRTARGKPEQLTDRRPGDAATRPSGRRTASASRSPTRTASSSSSTSPTRRSRRSPTTRRQDPRLRLVARRALARVLAERTATGFRSLCIWSAADGRCTASRTSCSTSTARPGIPRASTSTTSPTASSRRRSRPIEWNFAANRMTGIFALALRKDVQEPVPAAERRGDARREEGRGRKAEAGGEEKDDEGREGRGEAKDEAEGDEKKARAGEDRLRRARRRASRACRSTPTTTEASPPRRGTCSTSRRGASSTAATAAQSRRCGIFRLEGAQGDDAGRGRRRLRASRATAPRCWCARTRRLQALRREAQGARTKKTVSTTGLTCDRVPAAGVGGDLRRGLAPLPRLLLRRRTCTATTGRRSASSTARCCRYVAHRSDLNYVIGEMIAELNVGHAYIAGRRLRDAAARRRWRCPGARFELDAKAGRYRIAKIFQGQNEEERYRSPLTEIGVDAQRRRLRAGDRRRGARAPTTDPYRLLRYKADRPGDADAELEGRRRRARAR